MSRVRAQISLYTTGSALASYYRKKKKKKKKKKEKRFSIERFEDYTQK